MRENRHEKVMPAMFNMLGRNSSGIETVLSQILLLNSCESFNADDSSFLHRAMYILLIVEILHQLILLKVRLFGRVSWCRISSINSITHPIRLGPNANTTRGLLAISMVFVRRQQHHKDRISWLHQCLHLSDRFMRMPFSTTECHPTDYGLRLSPFRFFSRFLILLR